MSIPLLSISGATAKAIWQYLKARGSDDHRVWLTEERHPITERGVELIIKRIMARAGIRGKKCSPHVFRHTFACNFLDNGGQELELQYLLGHSTLKMVEIYSKATKARRAFKAHQRFSPVERLGLK